MSNLELNKIYCESNLETMAKMPNEFIDLVVTSPPYDDLRTYNGYSFPFENIAKELYRVTKKGGVVIWIVNDATKNGTESGTSFKQALFFKQIGFNIHDTMIWNKGKFSAVGALKTRYAQVFEFMFVFTKGKLKTFNAIKDRKNITAGSKVSGHIRKANGDMKLKSTIGKITAEYGQRFNIWNQCPQQGKNEHPAPFPEQLANDHIISWSNENDLVYDPFMGSGTTAKMAILNNRKFIGSEISKEYVDIANKRLEPYLTQQTLF